MLNSKSGCISSANFTLKTKEKIMSKAILWVGFVLAIVLLLFGFFVAENAKPLMFVFWLTILFGSGYKLFFAKPQNK